MKMKTVYIYSLSDPESEEIRYVGKTVDPFNRFWGHIHEAKNNIKGKNEDKAKWIKSLLEKGIRPKLDILEEVLTEVWEEKEKEWINKYEREGNNLLNKTKGGKTGIISENCKIALSKSKNRGRKKGTKHSEETKEKIRAKRALQVITYKHRLNISNNSKIKVKIKEINFLNEEIIWDSISAAAKHYNVAFCIIKRYLEGKIKKNKLKTNFYYLN